MALNETILPEFEHEMVNTRKTLERVPEDRFEWQPHRKSWTMQGLATHLSNLPSWTLHALNEDSIDIAPVDGEPPKMTPAKSNKELLATFDKNVSAAREAIAQASDEDLLRPWTLLSGGKSLFTIPKMAVIRNFVMNHTIHHRAQLGVYLRLNDIAVPAVYGPSADEEIM